MFTEFPYTNFHDLNLDWIIKIAKDFLDQYTHIQEVIQTGEESLIHLTESGMEQLEAKANDLEALLNEWYTTHSDDIANQLADALDNIASDLSAALSTISSAEGDAISDFNNRAEEKALQTIATIPSDYSTLANTVQTFTDRIGGNVNVDSLSQFTHDFYYDIGGTIHTNSGVWKTTDYLPVFDYDIIRFTLFKYVSGNASIASIAFYDEDKTFIQAFDPYYLTSGVGLFTGWLAIPEGAVYYTATTKTDEQGSISTELYYVNMPVNLTPFETGGLVMYNHDGTTYTTPSTTPFRESDYVPIANMNRIEYNLNSFHGSGYTLEAVTFFDASLNRIGGIFPAIANGTRHYYGTAPIPAEAKYLKFFYRTDFLSESFINLGYSENLVNIMFIGDSITEGAAGVESYVTKMQPMIGYDYTLFNAGVGGINAGTWWNNNVRALLDFPGINVVVIMLGLNGGMTDTFDTDVDPYNNYLDYANTITGNTCKMIEWIQLTIPDALIVFATPTYAISAAHEQQAENQIDCIPELVKRYNIPVIDIHTLCGVNAKNASNFIVSDNVHDNEKYSQKIAMAMTAQLKSIINFG